VAQGEGPEFKPQNWKKKKDTKQLNEKAQGTVSNHIWPGKREVEWEGTLSSSEMTGTRSSKVSNYLTEPS
jgi:hypothetical protein